MATEQYHVVELSADPEKRMDNSSEEDKDIDDEEEEQNSNKETGKQILQTA